MKIQVTQTLPNGQVLQQVLSKEGGEALKVQVQPGAKVSFNMEGTKPTEGGNAKAKTGSVKKVGNNLVLEAEGEALVEVTDFYSTPGASVGDLGWNYVASDAAVTAATPEAQALAADAAATESGALLPAIAPGWLAVGGAAAVAAAGSNGGSDAAKVVGAVLVIGLALGPLTDAGSGTTVKVYKANGTELAGSGTWVDGKFVFTPTEAYSGKVFIRVIDGDAVDDYMDEATGVEKNMGSDLWAATEVGSGASSVPITVTPITTIAALKAVGATSVTDMSTKVTSGNGANADITNTNKAIATLFGLSTSEDLAQQTPEMAITSAGTSSTPNTYGKALAVISKVDVTTGSFAQTIDQLVATTTVTGATASFAGSSVVTALAAAATSTTVLGATLNSAEIQASAAAAPADSTVPVFTSAAVSANGLTLTLTYGEALDGTNVPVANDFVVNDFVVNVGGVARAVSSLFVSGSTVVLTLASAVSTGQTVTVGYADPNAGNDVNAIQDTAGNDAATIAAQTVTNSSTVTVPDQPGSIAAISGTVEQGQTLTAGSITDADGSISGTTYQWKADGANISGATGSTYVLTQAEVGKVITVVATYTDGHGSGKSVTSAATGAVANIDDAGSIAAISGTVEQGQTLTAGSITDADGSISGITYQWKADGNDINGATSSTYVLTQAEVGKVITVVATYTDGHGSGKSVTSAATGAVANIDDAGSIAAISGTVEQGQTLTAGSITDADGSISGIIYQWKAVGANISGATSSTYVLTQAEVGKVITVVATYTDGHGSGKSVTSTATAVVLDTTPPTVAITDDKSGTTNGDVTFTFTFSEAVIGFDADNVSLNTGTKGTFTALSGTVYLLVVTPPASGSGNIEVTTSTTGVTNAAGNTATAPSAYTQAYDTVAPTASLGNTGAGGVINATEATDAAGVTSVTAESGAAWTVTFTGTSGTVTKTGTGNGSAQAVALVAGDITTLGQGAVSVSVSATDAAGNAVTTSTGGNFVLDTLAPTASLGNTGAGGVINLTEATDAAGVTSVTAESGAAWTVTFTGTSGTVTKTGTGNGSAQAVALVAGDITTLGQGAVSVSVSATDAAGNAVTTSTGGDFVLETTAPTFSSATSAIAVVGTDTNIAVYDANATDNGGAADAGITYTLGGADANLFDIAANGRVTYKQSPTTQGEQTFTVTATDAAGNGQTQTVNLKVAPSVIDLPTFDTSKLIAPVVVEGRLFYVWDYSGDGTHDHWERDGKNDWMSQAQLETRTGMNAGNGYQFSVGGYTFALPEMGDSVTGVGVRTGTDVASPDVDNSAYGGLLSIWDAFNGTTQSGQPNNWYEGGGFWSKTESANGVLASLLMSDGQVRNGGDVLGAGNSFVVFEVLALPVL